MFMTWTMLVRASVILLLALNLAACNQGEGGGGGTGFQSIYVDATLGNDTTGNGTQTLPYQTLAKLATLTYSVPTTIYLKRGEVWHESLLIPASKITVDAYSTGAFPQINGSRQIFTWSPVLTNIYSAVVILNTGEALGNLSENGTMMTFVPWNTNIATTFASAPFGSYSYDFNLDTLYIKKATSPTGFTYLASVKLYGIQASGLSDISIKNVDVTRSSLHGIEFKNCVRCNVTNVTLENIGGAVIGANTSAPPDYLYAGNAIDYSNNSTDGQVSSVTITDIFDSCLAVETYTSNSTAASISMDNALISKCGFAGVELSVLSNGGTNINSAINNVTVSNTAVISAGKGWSGNRYGTTGHGMRIVADQNAGTMSGISVQTFTASDSAGDGIYIGGEVGTVNLHRINSHNNAGRGINVLDANATTLGLKLSSSLIYNNTGNGVAYNAPQGVGLQIYHNTFYNNGTINLAIYNQANLADIRNNAFYSSSAMAHLYSAAALSNPTVDHNCYNNVTNMFGYNGMTYSSVSAFNTATGFEANGIGGAVGLANPASGIFTLLSTSDCIGRGDSTDGITEDYTGGAFSSPPSSGAYEYP